MSVHLGGFRPTVSFQGVQKHSRVAYNPLMFAGAKPPGDPTQPGQSKTGLGKRILAGLGLTSIPTLASLKDQIAAYGLSTTDWLNSNLNPNSPYYSDSGGTIDAATGHSPEIKALMIAIGAGLTGVVYLIVRKRSKTT